MKRKILSIFALIVMAGGFTACDEDFDYLRSETRDEVDWFTTKVTIDSHDWNYSQGGNYYFADVRVRELDRDVYRGGIVCCYLYDGNDVQIQLPYTRHYNEGGQEWIRTIDYEFYKRGITIYVTDYPLNQGSSSSSANDQFEPERPDDMTFRIALLN